MKDKNGAKKMDSTPDFKLVCRIQSPEPQPGDVRASQAQNDRDMHSNELVEIALRPTRLS